ncbi:MAG: thrombospondin type 3 repeat-containing protein [Bacteroidales bacterium]|nr:thrombospondin type 3 repeat-containing protein [Bacteroidales bacterium]
MGLGAEFRLAKKVSLNIEYGDHLTFKDATLDFFEAVKARDHYSYASAGLTFKFGGPKDQDNDGIKDKEDNCPDRAGKVELFGCPDADGDGISDDDDACPKDAGKLNSRVALILIMMVFLTRMILAQLKPAPGI